ncbi:NAD-dependent dihydropyrimidine dehydrogenase, PreA subunit [Rhodoferax sp. OV413]|uniref:4Fe-4S dicluster domain-containing protein n=1 Tax=Rhodoferax sp. OV413 TaxID=1855285 RepID=UPI000883D73B|nr:ferredoxin family protein [Rhodoferax sp. OV413]SDP42118.1 NAD-dependent dihydropyrimidine dehydrogenase, PreA subunit [Rhodoferax sp. OV413]
MIALLLTDRCTSCQRCVQICPAQVLDAGHNAPPTIARPQDCQTCFACELYCQADALFVDPTVYRLVPVDAAAVRASGLLGVYRRDSGWDEWQADPRYANQHWRMEEVFARGAVLAQQRAEQALSTRSESF